MQNIQLSSQELEAEKKDQSQNWRMQLRYSGQDKKKVAPVKRISIENSSPKCKSTFTQII